MCGIAGIFAYGESAPALDLNELRNIRDFMVNRGPDGYGLWVNKGNHVGLAHRRLSILDLSKNGAQPMTSSDGFLTVTFNGEIYNYLELRSQLERVGYQFRSNCDTEILLALYHEHGKDMVQKLRGMYAFGVWDEKRQELFLARDPFGIKPLYYSDDGNTLRFASQVKALKSGNGIRLTPNPAAHAGFYVFGYVPKDLTLYREILSLPAGTSIILKRGSGVIKKNIFYNILDRFKEIQDSPLLISKRDQSELIRSALLESVERHLVSDVQVGIFLSAGIDSSVIADLAEKASSSRLNTVTLGFREFQGTSSDEVPLAELYAKHHNFNHVSRIIDYEEFIEFLPKILGSMDQPSCDGINSWLVAKAASECGLKVCLSGLGGDELLGGYPGFRQIPQINNFLNKHNPSKLSKILWRNMLSLIPQKILSPKYRWALDYGDSLPAAYLLRRSLFMQEELQILMAPDFLAEGIQELQATNSLAKSIDGIKGQHASISCLELSWYMRDQLLRDVDWASMANSLEVRVPFLDVDFFEKIAPLITSTMPPGKESLIGYDSNESLKSIGKRKKTGFSTPIQNWLSRLNKKKSNFKGNRNWAKIVYSEFGGELPINISKLNGFVLPKPNAVIIYRIGQLGDSLICLPTLDALRKKYPTNEFLLLTNFYPKLNNIVSAWDVFGHTGLFDGALLYPVVKNFLQNKWIQVKIFMYIRKINPAFLINLSPRATGISELRDLIFFKFLCGIKKYNYLRADDGERDLSEKSSHPIPEWRRLLNIATKNNLNAKFNLTIPLWADFEASKLLSGITVDDNELIAICPGSKMPSKRWPLDRYIELGRRILAENAFTRIVILGGVEDSLAGDKMVSELGPRVVNLAGVSTLFGSAGVLKKCKCYIGNDTGTMHLAAFLGVSCLALFSDRDEIGKWDPYGSGHIILRKTVECSGCMLEICNQDNRCLKAITVNDAHQAWIRMRESSNLPKTLKTN